MIRGSAGSGEVFQAWAADCVGPFGLTFRCVLTGLNLDSGNFPP